MILIPMNTKINGKPLRTVKGFPPTISGAKVQIWGLFTLQTNQSEKPSAYWSTIYNPGKKNVKKMV